MLVTCFTPTQQSFQPNVFSRLFSSRNHLLKLAFALLELNQRGFLRVRFFPSLSTLLTGSASLSMIWTKPRERIRPGAGMCAVNIAKRKL